MTELLEIPDVLDQVSPPEDEDFYHIVCDVATEAKRTIPMFAICGKDVTFDPVSDDISSDAQLCKECEKLWPKHLIHCLPGKKCNIPRPSLSV